MSIQTYTLESFRAGAATETLVGWRGGQATVARVTLATDARGASSLAFRLRIRQHNDGVNDGGSDLNIHYALGEDPEAFLGYRGGAGSAVSSLNRSFYPADEHWYRDISGSLARNLLPGRSYYLWLFMAGGDSCDWRLDQVLELSAEGSYGEPSRPTAEDGWFGQPLRIGVERAAEDLRHTITVSCAGHGETLCTRAEAWPAVTWTPALETYAPLITDADSAPALITVETFLGDQSLGSESVTVTLRFRPADLRPVTDPGWVTLSPVNSGAAQGLTGYIAGFSLVRAAFDTEYIHFAHGASLGEWKLTLDGGSAAASPWQAGPVRKDWAACYVTDSRGIQAGERFTLSPFYDWEAPALRGGEGVVYRSDAQGAPLEGGGWLAANCQALYSSLGGQNSVTVTAAVRANGEADFGAETAVTPGAASVIGPADPDLSQEVRLTVTDRLGGRGVYTWSLPTRRWAMKFNETGTAVAFGKAPEADKVLELPADWELLRDGSVGLFGREGVTETGGLRWRWRSSADGFTELWASRIVPLTLNSTEGNVLRSPTLSFLLPFGLDVVCARYSVWGNALSCYWAADAGTRNGEARLVVMCGMTSEAASGLSDLFHLGLHLTGWKTEDS